MGTGASNQNQVQSYNSKAKEKNDDDNDNDNVPVSGPARTLPMPNVLPAIPSQKNTSSNVAHIKNKSPKKAKNPDKSDSAISQTMVKSIDKASHDESKAVSTQPIINVPKEDKTEHDDLSQKIKQLEKELASNESKKLDLQEKVQLLEERLEVQSNQPTNDDSENLKETLYAKDQYILKLEKDSQTAQNEANKLRIKLKKRIRNLNNQLQEVRQDSSITQMELRSEIAQLKDRLKQIQGRNSTSPKEIQQDERESFGQESGGHSKIIVELSSQLSEQSEQISNLLEQASEKDKRIEELEAIIHKTKSNESSSEHLDAERSRHLSSTSTDRLHSSRGSRLIGKQADSEVAPVNTKRTSKTEQRAVVKPPPLERQSTALSDSDSDWEVDSIPSHTRSAPARSRVKSAMSVSNSDHHKGSLVTLNGDDDSVIDSVSKSPAGNHLDDRQRLQKKSALKNHLQRNRNEKQLHSLMGPSLAFVNKTDQFSDTSCEPTPRYQDSKLSSHTRVQIVKPINE